MKKYLIAGVIAVVAFAMAGFAATLNVDGGIIQSGSDDTLTCTSDVQVASYTIEDGKSTGVRFAPGSFDGCDDDVSVLVYVYGADGTQKAQGDVNAVVGNQTASGLRIKYRGAPIDPAVIERVQVVLESN